MRDDSIDNPWFSDAEDSAFSEAGGHNVVPLPLLRDTALKMFGQFMAQQAGVKPEQCNFDDITEQRRFLSIEETDAIVRSHAATDDGEMMAVGANTRAEAMQKVQELMRALISRVMSNIIAEGVNRDLIDVAFDNNANDFAFCVNANGRRLVQENTAFFENKDDDE